MQVDGKESNGGDNIRGAYTPIGRVQGLFLGWVIQNPANRLIRLGIKTSPKDCLDSILGGNLNPIAYKEVRISV